MNLLTQVILVDEGIERTTYGTAVDVWSLGVGAYLASSLACVLS